MSKTSDGKGGSDESPSLRSRLSICFGIILFGMICAAPHPGAILFIPFYPLGLDKFFDPTGGSGVIGYSVFLIAIVVGVGVSSRLLFVVLCIVLAIICALTTSGCHRILQGLSGIT